MRTYKKTSVEKLEVDTVHCNKCGAQCDYTAFKDYASMDVCWGYHSNKDLEKHSWDLCEDCYDEFVATFAVPPGRYEYNMGTGEVTRELEDNE